MFRSLQMKLVLIMVLLIVSLMAVVGNFLISSVGRFYIDEFSAQMKNAFSNMEFFSDLQRGASEPSGAYRMHDILSANSGVLGIDFSGRNFYILDGMTGTFITGSDEELGKSLETTPNILTALTGREGYERSILNSYMDVAMPIGGADNRYIVYIKDTKQGLQKLTTELFIIILEALVFGLIISVVLSVLLSKTMTTPIEDLTKSAKLVAAGDFSHKLDVHSHDEIGVLTNTFNNMATVLHNTLEEIDNERNKLSTLFLHMTDGVIAFSRDGGIIHINPAATKMLRIKSREKHSYDSLFGDMASLDAVLAMRRSDFIEAQDNVDARSLKILLARFSDEKLMGGVIAVIRDITEQLKTEEMRREFVANVSHELRTPLTNIKSYTETLATNKNIPPETSEHFLNVILNEADRMTRIVQDLLALSRFDYGKMDWKYSVFPFYSAVQDAYNAVMMEASRRRQTLTLELGADFTEVRGDYERIMQVLMNILSNAIKYTHDGGAIDISAGAQGGRVWVKVRDNGIGIPEEDVPRIFERFYRVDKARSRESGGTGLGLSIAKEIIDSHGGTIEVISGRDAGTEVTITLPACEDGGDE